MERAASFFGVTRCIVFTPDELELVKGPPSFRRQFIDRTLSMIDTLYLENLVQFHRALKNRNRVLAAASSKQDRAEVNHILLPWNNILSRHARVIAEKRSDFSAAMSPRISHFYKALCSGAFEDAACKFESELVVHHVCLTHDDLMELYSKHLAKDLRFRTTTCGPQRDDLHLLLDTGFGFKNSRQIASQGQARCLALALKLAAAELILERTGEAPILLLDDVESELDRSRREALYHLLRALNSQTIITTTDQFDLTASRALNCQVMNICAGEVVV